MKTLLAVSLLVLAGCAGGAAPSPAASGAPSPAPTATSIATSEDAAARVIEVNPSLAGIGPEDADLIGGCCFWRATETDDGFEVEFEVGWGDCPAGCIDRHRWTYAVSRDGAVELLGEEGPAVPSGLPGGSGGAGDGGGILPGGAGIEGLVTAGPTCPVVAVDDPACDDRPLPGATIVILDAAGREVARVRTDAAGRFAVTLPAGPYTLEPQPVEGFVRVAAPLSVTVADGYVTTDLAYDTGLR